jgi:hypothetical protein
MHIKAIFQVFLVCLSLANLIMMKVWLQLLPLDSEKCFCWRIPPPTAISSNPFMQKVQSSERAGMVGPDVVTDAGGTSPYYHSAYQ